MQTSLYIQLLKMSFFPFAMALVDHCSMSAQSNYFTQNYGIYSFIHPCIYLYLPTYLHIYLLCSFFSSRPDKTFLVISKHMYQCLIDSFTYII